MRTVFHLLLLESTMCNELNPFFFLDFCVNRDICDELMDFHKNVPNRTELRFAIRISNAGANFFFFFFFEYHAQFASVLS